MERRLAALAGLILALGAQSASSAAPSVRHFSPEALLAADVPWSTVRTVAGKDFWPELPAFNSIIDEESPQPLTAVSQAFDQVGQRVKIVTRLYAYANAEIALEFLQSNAIVVEQIDQQQPAVGDTHFYFVTTLSDGSPSTRLFFLRGPFGVEIQVDYALWSKDKIAGLALPIDQQLQQLLAGKLRPPPIPPSSLAHLPAASAAPGPLLGTAIVPAEAWALAVHRGSPRAIRDTLVKGGNATFLFRRYLRKGSNTDVIELTLFSFANAGGARGWFAPFQAGVKENPAGRLDAGQTGPFSAFRHQLDNYELQFVSGRYVGDVFCWAPFVATASAGCEAATRAVAESWYATLRR